MMLQNIIKLKHKYNDKNKLFILLYNLIHDYVFSYIIILP